MTNDTAMCLLIPFLGTCLGSLCVFFMRGMLSERVEKSLTGFAAGVMVAASIWSLIMPAIDESAALGRWASVPAVIGFWGGTLFLLVLDHVIPHIHQFASKAEGPHSSLSRSTMMVLAVTLHNIPEGMAVGVVLAGWAAGGGDISVGAALALSIGIAIQNFPEGAIVSMPLRAAGETRAKAFRLGAPYSFINVCPGYGVPLFICQFEPFVSLSLLHPDSIDPALSFKTPIRTVVIYHSKFLDLLACIKFTAYFLFQPVIFIQHSIRIQQKMDLRLNFLTAPLLRGDSVLRFIIRPLGCFVLII